MENKAYDASTKQNDYCPPAYDANVQQNDSYPAYDSNVQQNDSYPEYNAPPHSGGYWEPLRDIPRPEGYATGYDQPSQYNPYPQQGQGQGYPYGYSHHSSNNTIVTTQPAVSNVVILTKPSTNAGFAWFTCLCCFWPLGLVAVIMSCHADNAYNANQLERGDSYARYAKNFAIASLVVGVLLGGLLLTLKLTGVIAH